MPVTLPPGRLRLVTRPTSTGSNPLVNTIGTVVVAALASSAAIWLATITATGRRNNSATRLANRSAYHLQNGIRSRRSGPRRNYTP